MRWPVGETAPASLHAIGMPCNPKADRKRLIRQKRLGA